MNADHVHPATRDRWQTPNAMCYAAPVICIVGSARISTPIWPRVSTRSAGRAVATLACYQEMIALQTTLAVTAKAGDIPVETGAMGSMAFVAAGARVPRQACVTRLALAVIWWIVHSNLQFKEHKVYAH